MWRRCGAGATATLGNATELVECEHVCPESPEAVECEQVRPEALEAVEYEHVRPDGLAGGWGAPVECEQVRPEALVKLSNTRSRVKKWSGSC